MSVGLRNQVSKDLQLTECVTETYRRSMQRALITPNRTSLPRPMHPRNAIMIPRNQPHHILPNHRVLIIIHIIDPRDVDAYAREERFPACDWVRPDHGVHGCELEVFVQRRAAGGHDFVATSFTSGFEDWLGTGGCEGLHIGAEGGGHAVVAVRARKLLPRSRSSGCLTAHSQNTRAYHHRLKAYPAYARS